MVDTNGKAQLPQGGRFNQTEVESKRYTVRNQIDFDKTWKDHAVTAIAGLEFRETRFRHLPANCCMATIRRH